MGKRPIFRMNQQVDGTRTMHNFVASAFSVVEHTRNIHRDMYADDIPEYLKQRAAILDSHGPTQFVDRVEKILPALQAAADNLHQHQTNG